MTVRDRKILESIGMTMDDVEKIADTCEVGDCSSFEIVDTGSKLAAAIAAADKRLAAAPMPDAELATRIEKAGGSTVAARVEAEDLIKSRKENLRAAEKWDDVYRYAEPKPADNSSEDEFSIIVSSNKQLREILTDADIEEAKAACRRRYPKARGVIIDLVASDGEQAVAWLPMLGSIPRFERYRRITGYLVGTLDRWNDAKRAEEADRVKHGV